MDEIVRVECHEMLPRPVVPRVAQFAVVAGSNVRAKPRTQKSWTAWPAISWSRKQSSVTSARRYSRSSASPSRICARTIRAETRAPDVRRHRRPRNGFAGIALLDQPIREVLRRRFEPAVVFGTLKYIERLL